MPTDQQNRYYQYKVVRLSAYGSSSSLEYAQDLQDAKAIADQYPPWDNVIVLRGDIVYTNQED